MKLLCNCTLSINAPAVLSPSNIFTDVEISIQLTLICRFQETMRTNMIFDHEASSSSPSPVCVRILCCFQNSSLIWCNLGHSVVACRRHAELTSLWALVFLCSLPLARLVPLRHKLGRVWQRRYTCRAMRVGAMGRFSS